MNTVARHSEGRRPEIRSHEAEKPGGVANIRAHATVDTPKQTAANTKTRNIADAATSHKKTPSEHTDSTHKELRRMSRSELIEVIYALEQDNLSLQKENEKLRAELDDKDIRIATSGSIAEAALSLNHIFEDAQAAADQYLSSVKHAQNSIATPRGRHAS